MPPAVSQEPVPPPLALTMGDPAGIGLDIALAAWVERDRLGLPPFMLIADAAAVAARAQALRLAVPCVAATPESASAIFQTGLPVTAVPGGRLAAPVVAGRPDPANGTAVIAAIAAAVELVVAGRAAAVVTNPIAKSVLYAAGFRHPGHTEYLAAEAERHFPGRTWPPVMMLVGPMLRVVPLTIHIPLARVPAAIDADRIVAAARTMAASFAADFAIAAPRIAVAGLNPHAGESGTIGTEDEAIVRPAVARLVAEGIRATGPHSADTLFHAAARAGYDAVLCMYHDQALIPLKTLAFDDGVNVTLGLPFVRTSPDHGTAFDIAGTGRARPASLVAALRLAAEMAARRLAARPA